MSDLIFNPVQGPEHLILNRAKKPGFVYFSTDTGKIFLDIDDTERIAVGGSGATVLYSSAEKIIANTNDTYTILYSDLDDQNASPKSGDLIINSDGRFFKVNYYNAGSSDVNCKLIAVSGTGGGGNYPGGSDQETNPKAISVTYHDLTYTFLNGKEYTIDLTPFSQVDLYLNISYSVRNSQNYITGFGNMQIKSGARVSLPVGQYITPEGGIHAVDITIEGANSIPYPKTINKIKCIDLKVEAAPDKFKCENIFNRTVPYYVTVKGQINKILYVEIDGQSFLTRPMSESEEGSSEILIDCKTLDLDPGIHTITTYLVADGIPSNQLITDFIYHPDNTPDATYVIVTDYPKECMSYETPMVSYWVYNTAQAAGHVNTINYLVNGVILPDDAQEAQNIHQSLTWEVTNLNPNEKNICEIRCGSGSRSFEIYCHQSNIFDPTKEGAILMLNGEGRTNNVSLERRSEWSYTNSFGTTYKANLLNFNWNNNGWMSKSTTGRSCLRISNGASVEIPISLFPDSKPKVGGYTFEFEFKPYNLYSYNLLTKTTETVENETNKEDDEVQINRTFNSDLAVISYIATGNDNQAYGMCCGTQDAFFRMSDGKNTTVRYTNNEIVNIAVTINAATQQICMYVNGVMSGMVAYDRESALLPIAANKLIINSSQCDLDLFNIRLYNQALTSKQIVQNYIANKKDMDIYKSNVFNAEDDTVKLADLQNYNTDNPSNATIPYMIFKTKSPDILPFNKANEDVVCSIEFVNPALDYALAKGDIDEEYYKKHAPSFTVDDVPINVQGTSSQKYPRKNFKGKFKNAKNWQCRENSVNDLIDNKSLSKFYIDENIAEKTICWKADYMDSSSCHNTGFASYAQELYRNHPLDYYERTNVAPANKDGITGPYHKQYRTSLYGFPVLVFHQKSNGETEFIGRYNFNLDKGADDTLGMALEKKHPILTDKNYDKVCECWEFSNNMGGRCSFRGNPFDYNYDYDYENADGTKGAYIINGKEGSSDIGDDLEVRYHHNDKAIEGAWKNLTAPADDGGKPISSREAFEVLLGGDADGNNRTGAYAHLERLFKWLQSCYYAFDMTTEEDKKWVTSLLGHEPITDGEGNYYDNNGEPVDPDFKALRNARKTIFYNEFDKHLNKEYCMIYYIMTELLLQYDSRGKNMMLSSWGPMEAGGEYIWFPIFYDIDTQLGVNNSGVPSWEYNVEPTTGFNNPDGGKAFSTANSLLWNNFHQMFAVDREDVQEYYKLLRGSTLTIAKLNGYYNFDYNISGAYCMKGILPISVINANQNYKYIAPSIDGYVIDIDDTGAPEYRTTSAYFYCLQGTRELHRAQLLRNRFNYYDSKWMAQDYQPGTGGASMRWRGNRYTNDLYPELNSNLILRIKPSLDQYLVLWLDEAATFVVPIFVQGGEIVEINLTDYMTSSEYQDQLIYIGGYSYLQEFGNVSLLYLSEYEYPDNATNITKIEMGNENAHYRNNHLDKEKMAEATRNKPLLKVFDITNIILDQIDTSINLSDSIKLETFKALGTNIVKALFADGVNLKHLYLPNTITSLHLNKASNLEKIIYNPEELKVTLDSGQRVDANGIYIEDVVKEENGHMTTKLDEIDIVGDGLKLYSYEFLKKITDAVLDMSAVSQDKNLAINMKDVHWTPYTLLGDGAEYDKDKANNYKYATNNYSFRAYNYESDEQWNLDILNKRIYEYIPSDISAPSSLSLLNTYIYQDKVVNIGGKEIPKHFTDITTSLEKHLPVITGEMFIDNSSEEAEAISEADIANIYNVYFPDLSIKAANIKNAYRARFVRVDDGIESEIKILRFDYPNSAIKINPPDNNEVSAPVHYDFKGWSKTNPNTVSDINNIEIINPNDFSKYNVDDFVNNEITFYAIYEKHKYDIYFEDPTALLEGDKYEKIISIEYGLTLREPSELPLRRFQEENELALTERLSFKGWTTLKDSAGIVGSEIVNNILTDITSYKADHDYHFYAVFVKENVFEVSTDSKYFIIEPENGMLSIRANPEYQLSGKITLPAQYGEQNISIVGNFSNMTQISHVFFKKDGDYQIISKKAFYNDATENGNPSLKAVYLPDSITTIRESAFQGQVKLEYVSENALNDAVEQTLLPAQLKTIENSAFYASASISGCLHINALPNQLKSIGNSAFYNAGSQVTIKSLPDSLEYIGEYGFAYLPDLAIESTNKLKTIEQYAFGIWNDYSHAPTSGVNVDLFTVESSVLSVESGAFDGYGRPSTSGGLKVILETSKIAPSDIENYFGPNAFKEE